MCNRTFVADGALRVVCSYAVWWVYAREAELSDRESLRETKPLVDLMRALFLGKLGFASVNTQLP